MTRMAPRGNPTTSTERMRLKKLRDMGVIPPPLCCSVCGQPLKEGAGANRAYRAGLCWEHWDLSPEGRRYRRRYSLKDRGEGVWAVGYFSGKPGEPLERRSGLREAIGAAYMGKGAPANGPLYVVWCDGRVSYHLGLTVRSAKGLSPEHPSTVFLRADDPRATELRAQIPENLTTWFDT